MEITAAVKDGNRGENNSDYEKLQGTDGEKSLELKRQHFPGYEKQQRRAKQKRRHKDGLGWENNFTAETIYGQIFKTSVI